MRGDEGHWFVCMHPTLNFLILRCKAEHECEQQYLFETDYQWPHRDTS